jgi:hypothetical protein
VRFSAILSALALASWWHTGNAEVSGLKTSDPRTEAVLDWLPAETQSILVIRAPNIVFDQPVLFPVDPESSMQFCSLRCLWGLYSELHQADVSLSIDSAVQLSGSSNEKPGETAKCTFVFLTPNNQRNDALKSYLRENAGVIYEDCGQTIVQLRECSCHGDRMKTEAQDANRICMPKPNLIICSNDRLLLHRVLSRMNSPLIAREALPPSSPEWREVNQDAPYWAVRHYFGREAKIFSSNGEVQGLDRAAIGLTFEYSPINREVNIAYLSSNPDIEQIGKQMTMLGALTEGGSPEIRYLGRGPLVFKCSVRASSTSQYLNVFPILLQLGYFDHSTDVH